MAKSIVHTCLEILDYGKCFEVFLSQKVVYVWVFLVRKEIVIKQRKKTMTHHRDNIMKRYFPVIFVTTYCYPGSMAELVIFSVHHP